MNFFEMKNVKCINSNLRKNVDAKAESRIRLGRPDFSFTIYLFTIMMKINWYLDDFTKHFL